jgi:hypothetical protein
MLSRMPNSTARALVIAATLCVVQPRAKAVWGSGKPQGPNQGSGFLGAWCAQGDPAKQASITSNGAFFTLTNEMGSTSVGSLQGMQQNVIVATGWQFVRGTLSGDGRRINWSNGTFWARCNGGGGGGGGRPDRRYPRRAVVWRDAQAPFTPGAGAIIGGPGNAAEPGSPLYLCRANVGSSVTPGKWVKGNCNVAYGGREMIMFAQDSGPPFWLRTHLKLKIRLTPSAAENCRTQDGIRHNLAKRQFYGLSHNHCHFEDNFAEMKHILAAPSAGSRLFCTRRRFR